MYIVDRNNAERAKYSSFDESVLREKSQGTFWTLAPFAVLGTILTCAALFQGASPLALLLAGLFLLVIASSKK